MKERIGLIGENSIEFVHNLINIWNEGNCVVLIDWRIPFQTAVDMLIEASVEKCYIDKNIFIDNQNCDYSRIDFILYEKESNSANILPDDIYNKFKDNYSDNEAVIIYSSGTTGKAKGIILSHYAININADAIIDYMKPKENDCMYIAKSLTHSSTITGELLVALKKRIKLVIAPTIVPPRFILNNINKYQVSIICFNPTLLSLCCDEYSRGKYNLSSLHTIYVSGSILNDKVYKEAHQIFKNINIYNVYGLSEAAPRVTAQRDDCNYGNSVGKPIKNVKIKIIDYDGNEVVQGKEGVIHILTPSIFSGYVTKNEKLPSLYNGWLNSGDIGYIDEHEELHIVGRIDDLIIINSHKIYPSTIEGIINKTPEIKNCCVRSYKENVLTCFYETLDHNDIGTPVLIKNCKKFLSSYEVPQEWIHLKELPKTLNGKINNNELKKIYKG